MSDERFTLIGLDNETIKNDVTKECYFVIEYVQRKKLVDLLNEMSDKIGEQQATIKKQSIRIHCQDKEIQKLLQQLNNLTERIGFEETI